MVGMSTGSVRRWWWSQPYLIDDVVASAHLLALLVVGRRFVELSHVTYHVSGIRTRRWLLVGLSHVLVL